MRKLVIFLLAATLGATSVIGQEAVAPHFRLGFGAVGFVPGQENTSEISLDLLPASLPDAIVGDDWNFDFSDYLAVTGNPGAITWTLDASGSDESLPIDIDDLSQSGVLSGIALQAGEHTFSVAVQGELGGADQQTYSLQVETAVPEIAFALEDVVDALPDELVVSDTVTPTGVLVPTPISATNGVEISVSGGPFSSSGLIDVNQSFVARVTADAEASGVVISTITIGDVEQEWRVSTIDELVVTLTSRNSVMAAALFGADWVTTRAKRIVVPSGVVIGSSGASSPALRTGTGFSGKLTVQVNNGGQIRGRGGMSGSMTVGNNGGDGLVLDVENVLVLNYGAIYGGGGAGGAGGRGGDGRFYSAGASEPVTGPLYEAGVYRWRVNASDVGAILWNGVTYGIGANAADVTEFLEAFGGYYYYRGDLVSDSGGIRDYQVHRAPRIANTKTGTLGGLGGQGEGYNMVPTLGQYPAATPEQNAGAGGRGGQGGFLGQPGATGEPGGSGIDEFGNATPGSNGYSGGRAGYAIKGTPAPGSVTGITLGYQP